MFSIIIGAGILTVGVTPLIKQLSCLDVLTKTEKSKKEVNSALNARALRIKERIK